VDVEDGVLNIYLHNTYLQFLLLIDARAAWDQRPEGAALDETCCGVTEA
jgi:hypothetical protein